jgi:arylformamidase
MTIMDISIPLDPSSPVWQGDSRVQFERISRIQEGSVFNVTSIKMGIHNGTHIDAPKHIIDSAITVDRIPLDVLVGRVQVVEIPENVNVITAEVLDAVTIDPDCPRILFKTTNSTYWVNDPLQFHPDFVALDSSAAHYLVCNGVRLAGIDYFSISPLNDLVNPHLILLEAGVVILENVNLSGVSPGYYRLVCLPLKLVGIDGAPVRAILEQV